MSKNNEADSAVNVDQIIAMLAAAEHEKVDQYIDEARRLLEEMSAQ